ncbi:DUF922 domain-containing protein [Roseibium sp. M-1]
MTIFIVLIGPILGSGDISRAEIRSDLTEKSYVVRGTSAMEVAAFMRNRPFRGDYGPAIANIRPRYSYTFKTEKKQAQCRITQFRFQIHFTMTLPKARNEKAFDKRTRSAWRSLRSFTRRHEMVHRRIYLDCARDMERKVMKLRPRSCGGIDWQIRRIVNDGKKACREKHLAFDRRELKRLTYHRFFEMARRERDRRRATLRQRADTVRATGRVLFYVGE